MAVYTKLSESDISSFLASYDVGKLESFKGIAEGVSNTNYLLTTSHQPQATIYSPYLKKILMLPICRFL
jgi:homoserine kinase type II